MAITIDTHALIWYIDRDLHPKLSKKALKTVYQAETESTIYIPIIVLMEVLYLYEKGRINLAFKNLLTKIVNSSNYKIIPFDLDILKVVETLEGLEAHDRIILATAQITDTPLVSKDRELRKTNTNVIW